jgi:hypothetical protein
MTKSLKIFLSVLALISIIFSLSIIFGWIPFQKLKTVVVPVATPLIERENSTYLGDYPELKEIPIKDENNLFLPVEEKYLDSALLDEENPQVLSFFLEPEESIKAIFKGSIREIIRDQKPFSQDNAFNEIFLYREDNQFYASYIIFGGILVNEGDIVEQGQEIAKAKEGGLAFRSGTNLSLWIHDKDGEFIKLSKEMFVR